MFIKSSRFSVRFVHCSEVPARGQEVHSAPETELRLWVRERLQRQRVHRLRLLGLGVQLRVRQSPRCHDTKPPPFQRGLWRQQRGQGVPQGRQRRCQGQGAQGQVWGVGGHCGRGWGIHQPYRWEWVRTWDSLQTKEQVEKIYFDFSVSSE